MIRFTCPDCGKALKAPDGAAGHSGRCRCGAVFAVPHPPGLPAPSAPPPPGPRVVDYEPDDEPEPYIPRRRRKKGTAPRWLALGGLFLLAVVAAAWAGVRWARRPGNPTPAADSRREAASTGRPEPVAPLLLPDLTGDGPDWTYKELLDHLRARGLYVHMFPVRGSQVFVLARDEGHARSLAAAYPDYGTLDGVVVAENAGSARNAKSLAGRYEKDMLVWGRFWFRGREETLALVRQALAGRGPAGEGVPDLTYDDVAGRLRAAGLAVKMRTVIAGGMEGRALVLTDREEEADLAARLCGGPLPPGVDQKRALAVLSRTVLCERHGSALQARQEAVDSPQAASFAWGRFVFGVAKVDGKPSPTLEQVRRALGAL